MRAIGIDLGTTNSAAAVGGEKPCVLPTRDGEQLTPSVVSLVTKRKGGESEVVVGRRAANNAARNPEGTIFSVKRLMGRVYGEAKVSEVQKRYSYRLAPPPPASEADHSLRILLGARRCSPTEVSAMILKQVKEDAEKALGEPVTHAVITVPAYFEERQIKATRDAGELAGLKVLQVLAEPSAAAIAFGTGREREKKRVLVYDLGGGTFDISIVQMTGGQYHVLEISGDNWLGGNDFDETIVKRIVEWVKREHGVDPSGDAAFLVKARVEAEKAKIALSQQQSVEIDLPLFHRLPNGDQVDLDLVVTRADFEADIGPMVARSIDLVRAALKPQNLTPDDITEVLMVGGSTLVPLVFESVSAVFGKSKVKRHVNPMECVALGAGILASQMPLATEEGEEEGESAEPAIHVQQVTAMHLGIAAVSGNDPDRFFPIIPKGTPYPLREPKREVFTPSSDDQEVIRVPVYEGLSDRASLNEQQGVVELPLRRSVDRHASIEVSFNYDKDRILTVTVRVLGTDEWTKQDIRHDVRRAAPKGDGAMKDDWREELQPWLRAATHFLDTYGEFMAREDRAELEKAKADGDRALTEEDKDGGEHAVRVIRNKIFNSGIASQLWIAEGIAMRQARTDREQRDIADAAAQLRRAHARGNIGQIQEVSTALRMTLAPILARGPGREVEDKPDYEGLLRKDRS